MYKVSLILLLAFATICLVPNSLSAATLEDLADCGVKVTTRLAEGSGVIVSSDGLVVTCYHVIGNQRHIVVDLNDGKRYAAELLAIDRENDLALLQIDSDRTFKHPVFANKITYGEDVYYAADCDFIYIGINRTVGAHYGIFELEFAFLGAFNITVPGDGIVILGVEVIGFTTACVEIRVDRSVLPDPCKVDPVAIEIRIHGITYEGQWMHALLNDIAFDCGPAEIKKFLEIYKQVIIPGDPDMTEEIYCTDFEEPCDIYDEWATFDMYPTWGDNGAIDTWTWSDKRSNSPDHSFHSTSFDT